MKKNNFLLSLFLFTSIIINAQSYISATVNSSYWQHTDLIGFSGGIGFAQNIRKNHSINFQITYGYGEYNRYNQLKNVNYDNETTVVITKGHWVTDLGADGSGNRPQNTDFARNYQLNINYKFPVFKKINFGIGLFTSYVEQAYSFNSIDIYYISAPPFVGSAYNFIPIAEQNFVTAGVTGELSLDLKKDNKIYSPYLDFGLGVHKTSYLTLGVRLSAELLKK